MSELLEPGKRIRPVVDKCTAALLARQLYGLSEVTIKELNGYDDRNFHLQIKQNDNKNFWEHGYVLKIINSIDSENTLFIDAQNELLVYLGNRGFCCPEPVKNLNGNYYSKEHICETEHVVRLLKYQPGMLLHEVPLTDQLMFDVGNYVAQLDVAMQEFYHPGLEKRRTIWMLQNCPMVKKFLFAVQNNENRDLVTKVLESFEHSVLQNLHTLTKGLIHGDFNEQNILVHQNPNKNTWAICGILDFGDCHQSFFIFELAITMCYIMLLVKEGDPICSGAHVIAGYNSIKSLPSDEMKLLKICICARLCQSLVLGSYTYTLEPDDYLLLTAARGWDLLRLLWNVSDERIAQHWIC